MGSDRAHSLQTQDDESPVHTVQVDAFECAVYPVTEAEFGAFVDATGRAAHAEWRGRRDDIPVTAVSWFDAVAFCEWRTALGDPMRLPTEAEWERAARGGVEGARYPWGDELPAWLPNGGRGPVDGPWRVSLGEPNGFGVFGIGANIHEWCADWHSSTYYATSPRANPRGPSDGVRRVSRGGAWRHAVTASRCAQRSKLSPQFRYTDYGFRVVR